MAVPKKKTSKRRSANRRSANMKIDPIVLTKCPKCGEPKRAHIVCQACGTYKGKQVIEVETKLDKKLKRESKQQAASDKE